MQPRLVYLELDACVKCFVVILWMGKRVYRRFKPSGTASSLKWVNGLKVV